MISPSTYDASTVAMEEVVARGASASNVEARSVRSKTLMACVELGRTLSRKVNPDAFLFKATKGS
jgi:hypothetical protein